MTRAQLARTTEEQRDHLSTEIQELIDECLEEGKITHADHNDRSENLATIDLPLGSLFRVRDHFVRVLSGEQRNAK